MKYANRYITGSVLLCLAFISCFGQTDTSAIEGCGRLRHLSRYQRYDSIYHHTDTALKHQLIIKLNPGLFFMEQGLMLQYNVDDCTAVLLGGGYNEDNSGNAGFHTFDGAGYTIRLGILRYLGTHRKFYLSCQGFYRYYGNITAVAQDGEGIAQGIDDQVINPLRTNLTNVTAGDGNQVDIYNASANILCFDVVGGYQYRRKHFVFDAFAGLGWRSKTIYLQEVGYYVNAIGSPGPGEMLRRHR